MAKENEKNVGVDGGAVTAETVKQMIAEALRKHEPLEVIRAEIAALSKVIPLLPTEDRVAQMIRMASNEMFEHVNAATLETITADGELPQQPLDPAWLDGLTFQTATQEKRIVEGRPRMVATPVERELMPEDVLGYRVSGNQVFIVAADGKKYTVDI